MNKTVWVKERWYDSCGICSFVVSIHAEKPEGVLVYDEYDEEDDYIYEGKETVREMEVL